MDYEDFDERTARIYVIATVALHCTVIVLGFFNIWWLAVSFVSIAVSYVVLNLSTTVYDGHQREFEVWKRVKDTFFVSTLFTLGTPWLVVIMRQEYIENMIRDIIE